MCIDVRYCCLCLAMFCCLSAPSLAQDPVKLEKDWGVGFVKRMSSIPYGEDLGTVEDIVPELYYEGQYLYLRGTYGGIRFIDYKAMSLSLMGAFRYFDIPSEYQNEYQGSNVDVGLQFEYAFGKQMQYQLEWMSDSGSNQYVNNHLRHQIEWGDFSFDTRATLRLKSAEFNDRYYGLNWLNDPDSQEPIGEDIGSDFDITIGSKVRYHLWRNLYLLGEANLTRFGNKTAENDVLGSSTQAELFLGFGVFNDKKTQAAFSLPDNHYLRLAYGWATSSNIGDIIFLDVEEDLQNNRLSSVFYGMPLSDVLFDAPIHTYLTTGFIYQFASNDYVDPETQDVLQGQEQSTEYVLAIKFYYTVPWPTKWRIGFAEGLSYVSAITNIEKVELDEKGYETSKLMNYLDLSLDISLGDLFNYAPLDPLWLGYSMHHRSGIFEASSSFGRIKGGSNYNTVYLQWHW